MNGITLREIAKTTLRHRFAVLLATQLVLLVAVPAVQIWKTGRSPVIMRLLIGLLFIALVLSTLVAVSDRSRLRWAIYLVGIPTLLLEVLDMAQLGESVHVASHLISVVFLGLVIYAVLQFIFRSDRVDSNVLFASLCVYIMLGTLFAYLYAFLECVAPGSFHIAEEGLRNAAPLDIGGTQSVNTFYFSYVTMTTLGYGDIYPVSAIAKMTATLQSILGQLYLTVLVARLVGQHIAHSQTQRDKRQHQEKDQ
jgi:hypothetical protein